MARKSAKRAADRAEMVEQLFEHSCDLLYVTAPDGIILLVNPAFAAAVGRPAAEIAGRHVLEFFHPDDHAGMRDRVRKSLPGVGMESEVRLLGGDGAVRWYAGRRQLLPDGRHVVSMRDATDEIARRLELEEARRTRKLLGLSAGIGLWTYDPAHETTWWSDELFGMLGLAPGSVTTGADFAQLVHPRDRQRVRETLGHAIRTGEPANLVHRIRGRDGWRTLRATVHTEPHGKYWALKGISQDITEMVEARDAARRGEQQSRKARREALANAARLKLALQAAEAGVYEIDHVKRTFWASPEFERITGRRGSSYEEALVLNYPGFHKDDLPHVRESFRALHRGDRKAGESFEARIVHEDGSERWVRVHHHLKVARSGRWLKAVGLVQDCDARKRQELALQEAQRAAEAAAEAKSAFLANMSHEIRTPLNGVMGVLHLLKEESLSAEGRDLLEEALSCGQMLGELLNDVIDFSKIEAGRLELACEPVDPRALVQGVARLLQPQAQAKGLEVAVEVDGTIGWVRADPVRLRQALFNLVGNAVKFTEKGRVAVRCRRVDGGRLRFEVEDTGVGISKAAQARIFQRFDQGDASTTRRFGGSGLGLAITRRLAELMGGDVGFVSAVGRGSTFWMEIAAEPAEAREQQASAPLTVLQGLRVLVVEDNATNRLIATKLLENLGASVETAADGYMGVEAASRGGFDLILMDVQMPGIDGLEAARRIRALGAPAAATPIVALTANVLSHQRLEYLAAGMDGVVGKPISPATLLKEIAKLGEPDAGGASETAVA
jgi:PAS domain S-box-containing protein